MKYKYWDVNGNSLSGDRYFNKMGALHVTFTGTKRDGTISKLINPSNFSNISMEVS